MIPATIGKKKNKPIQYVVGGTVAVIILGLWISMPLMNNSTFSSTVSAGNPFNSKVANISALSGSDIAREGGAGGTPLSGEMIDNPATSGEEILSSLFQSGPSEELGTEAAAAPADAAADAPSVDGPGGSGGDYSPAPSPRSGGKLAAVASLGGGGGGSMTAGAASSHNKFFGGGGSQKAEFSQLGPSLNDTKKIAEEPGRKNALTSSLNNTLEKSKLAAKSADMSASRSDAANPFSGSSKGGALADLSKNSKQSEDTAAGLDVGASTTGNLKKSDPSMSKRKVAPPPVNASKEEESKDPNEELKKMLIQMLIKSALGMVMGG